MNTASTTNPSSRGKFHLKLWITLGVISFLIIILFAGGCSTYNNMVKAEETVDEAWANVQAAYQRRFDLIPNLVSTVKGYAQHESQTLQNVTNARAGLIQTGDSLLAVSNGLKAFNPNGESPSVSTFENLARGMNLYVNAVHEAYPDLKASQNFMNLQNQLETTENRINTERNFYNEKAKEYNVTIRKFPNNIFAGMFGFDKKNMFDATPEAQSAPTVNF